MKTILVFIVLLGGCSGHISINSKKSDNIKKVETVVHQEEKEQLSNYKMLEIGTIDGYKGHDRTSLYILDIDGTKYYATYGEYIGTYGTRYIPIIGPKVESKQVEKEF